METGDDVIGLVEEVVRGGKAVDDVVVVVVVVEGELVVVCGEWV